MRGYYDGPACRLIRLCLGQECSLLSMMRTWKAEHQGSMQTESGTQNTASGLRVGNFVYEATTEHRRSNDQS